MDKFKLNLTFIYLFSMGLMSTFAFTEFEEIHLKQHNKYRKKHHVPPLILSQELCDYAQEWAEKLAIEGKMKHRPKGSDSYGENIFFRTGGNVTNADAKTAVDMWYDEIKDYDFINGIAVRNKVIGHFTQVVWKSSKEMGVGFAHKNKKLFIVANYSPQGNIRRRYIENVIQSGGSIDGKLASINIKLVIINFLIVNIFFIYLK